MLENIKILFHRFVDKVIIGGFKIYDVTFPISSAGKGTSILG